MNINEKIIGTWKLVYSVEIDTAGNKHYPFGIDAIGYIIYDKHGQIAVQITRKNRTNFKNKSYFKASADEISQMPYDYLAYFGRYEINTENELVRHHIEGHVFPNTVGEVLERKYHFYDDKMSLKPWDETNREILWQKIQK